LKDKAFRELVDQCFHFSGRGTLPILRTTRTLDAGIDFGAVGTAYDYCLRLALIRTHDLAMEEVPLFSGITHYLESYRADRNVRGLMEKQQEAILDYLDFNLSDASKLLEACLFLSKFDAEYRSGQLIFDFTVKSQDVAELAQIVDGSRLDWAMGRNVSLGPDFSISGSVEQICADGDLVVDDMLVDIKTSARLDLKASIRQLISYRALNLLARNPQPIESVGVYYPRFDFFLCIPINDLQNPSQQKALVSHFQGVLDGSLELPSLKNSHSLMTPAGAVDDSETDTLTVNAIGQ